MSHLRLLLLTWIVAATVAGCRKSDSGTTAGPVVPDDPSSGLPNGAGAVAGKGGVAPGDKDVSLDLFARTVSAAKSLCRRERRLIAERPGGDSLHLGDTFRMEVEKPRQTLANVKASWAPQVVQWHRDEPTVLLAEFADNQFAFDSRIALGDQEYRVGTPPSAFFTREQAERMLRSALSLRQTDAIRASMKRESEVRDQLTAADCKIEDTADACVLTVLGDKVTDDDLAGVKEIAGLRDLTVGIAPRVTAKGTAHLAAAPALESVILMGPGITDEMAAPFRAATGLVNVTLVNHRVSDAGLSFLAALSNLEEFNLIGGPSPPRRRGSRAMALSISGGSRN